MGETVGTGGSVSVGLHWTGILPGRLFFICCNLKSVCIILPSVKYLSYICLQVIDIERIRMRQVTVLLT